MSTQFSLRRLSKMVKAIDALINETRDTISRSANVTINVHDEMVSIHSQVNLGGLEFETATDRFGELLSLRNILRLIIGTANQANGVNKLLTELQMVNTTLALYQHLYSRRFEEKLSESNLANRVSAAVESSKAGRADYGRFGGTSEDSLTVSTQTEEIAEWIKEGLSEAKFRSEAIVDQLERINTTIMLEIDDDLVLTLTQFEVIQDLDPVEPIKKILDEMKDESNPLGSPEGR